MCVWLSKNNKGKTFTIHRLVAKCFIPNPENLPVINHKDGIKFNNYFENLEPCTYIQNNQHAVKMGLKKSGAQNYNSKLTEEQIREIRKFCVKGNHKFGATAFARKFGVSQMTILSVVNFKCYKNVK